jgi:hypothetical protein
MLNTSAIADGTSVAPAMPCSARAGIEPVSQNERRQLTKVLRGLADDG